MGRKCHKIQTMIYSIITYWTELYQGIEYLNDEWYCVRVDITVE